MDCTGASTERKEIRGYMNTEKEEKKKREGRGGGK